MNLAIENVGAGSACNIKLRLSLDFKTPETEPLRNVGPFRNGINLLVPHQRLELFLANAIGNLEELTKRPFEITAHYEDGQRRRYHDIFPIDFSQLEGIERVGEPPLFTIAEAVKKMEIKLSSIITGSKINIIAYSTEDIARERVADQLWHRIRRLSQKDREEVASLIEARLAAPTPPTSE